MTNALKLLAKLDAEAKDSKYANVPVHARPKSKFSDVDTNSMTTAILRFLELNHHWGTRINVQGQFKESLGTWIPSSTKKGTADIHAVLKPSGRHLSIELKKDYDKLSEAQEKVKADIEKAGGLYWEVRSFDGFYEMYQQWKTKQAKP